MYCKKCGMKLPKEGDVKFCPGCDCGISDIAERLHTETEEQEYPKDIAKQKLFRLVVGLCMIAAVIVLAVKVVIGPVMSDRQTIEEQTNQEKNTLVNENVIETDVDSIAVDSEDDKESVLDAMEKKYLHFDYENYISPSGEIIEGEENIRMDVESFMEYNLYYKDWHSGNAEILNIDEVYFDGIEYELLSYEDLGESINIRYSFFHAPEVIHTLVITYDEQMQKITGVITRIMDIDNGLIYTEVSEEQRMNNLDEQIYKSIKRDMVSALDQDYLEKYKYKDLPDYDKSYHSKCSNVNNSKSGNLYTVHLTYSIFGDQTGKEYFTTRVYLMAEYNPELEAWKTVDIGVN